MATWQTALTAGLATVTGFFSTSAFAPDFSVLLGGTADLQQRVAADAAKSARAAQAFGNSLSATERRDLQGACTALVANSSDADALGRLQIYLARYKDNSPEALLRFCLEPSYRQLQDDLQASRLSLQRASSAAPAPAGAALEDKLPRQQQMYQSISNVMKTRHDTAKNSINNVR